MKHSFLFVIPLAAAFAAPAFANGGTDNGPVPSYFEEDPVIDEYSPDIYDVILRPGEVQTFSVTASDDDGDELTCTWNVYHHDTEDCPEGFEEVEAWSFDFSSDVPNGDFDVEACVSDGTGCALNTWHVRIAGPLTAPKGGTIALRDAVSGVPYGQALGFGGIHAEPGTYYYARIVDGGIPSGMRIDRRYESADNIELYGEPDDGEIGDYAFTLRVADAAGACVERRFTLSVLENRGRKCSVESTSPETGWVVMRPGESREFSFAASAPDGCDIETSWHLETEKFRSGRWKWVRSDLEPDEDTSFEFTPEAAGFYVIAANVRFVDGERPRRRKTRRLRWWVAVLPEHVVVVDRVYPNAVDGQPYSVQLTATGGTAPYEWSLGELWRYWDEEGRERIYDKQLRISGLSGDGVLTLDLTATNRFGLVAGEMAYVPVPVAVSDSAGAVVSQKVWIAVEPGPAPEIVRRRPAETEAECPIPLLVSEPFPVSVEARDPDGLPLSFTWTLYGTTMECDENGENEFISRITTNIVAATADGNLSFAFPEGLEPGSYELELEVGNGAASTPATWHLLLEDSLPVSVSFDANGGTGDMDPVAYFNGVGCALPANGFVRKDHTFAGWAASRGGVASFADRATVDCLAGEGSSATLYAVWKPDLYTIVFDAAGGTGGWTRKLAFGAALVPPVVKRTGYVFAGWSPAVPATVGAANAVYKARWKASTYRIAFDKNGGALPKKKSMAAQTFAYGTAAILRKNAFVRKGYVFAGWAISKADAKKGVIAFSNAQKVKDIGAAGRTTTLYAVWAKPTYKVAFQANGGKGGMAPQTLEYGKAAKLRANQFTAPKGKVFAGWATSKAAARNGIIAYKNKKAVKNLVITGKTVKLYAVWKKK